MLKVVQGLLKNILKLVFAFLHEQLQAGDVRVFLWSDDLEAESVYRSVVKTNLCLLDGKFDDVVTQGVCSMATCEHALLDLKLIIVEKLFKKARLGVLVKLRADFLAFRVQLALLALRIDHYSAALACISVVVNLLGDHWVQLWEHVLRQIALNRSIGC